MPLSQITPRTIRHWQNEIMQEVDENGRKHKPSYLATIHTQLSCILNHAVRFYGLKTNVARMAGGMGTKEHCKTINGAAINFNISLISLAPFYLPTYILPCERRGNNVADG